MHTPGPWFTEALSTIGHCAIVDADGFTIANPSPMGMANARLIAKAPDLRDALQNLLTAIHNRENNPGFASAGNYVRALERARALLED